MHHRDASHIANYQCLEDKPIITVRYKHGNRAKRKGRHRRVAGQETDDGKGVNFEGVVITQTLYDHYIRLSK